MTRPRFVTRFRETFTTDTRPGRFGDPIPGSHRWEVVEERGWTDEVVVAVLTDDELNALLEEGAP